MDKEPDMNSGESHLNIWDGIVIVLYFLFVIGVGVWSSRKSKKESLGDYFLASRNMHWMLVGASLFASNIGSGHFIGLAGSGASSGIGVAGFEFSAVFTLLMLGWLFVPVYLSSGVYTMPEYLRERFGGQRIRVYLSFYSLLLYIFTKISADIYAGALFIQLALNKTSTEWLYVSILILLGVAAMFTIVGGLTAVIWTDFVQTVLMIFGALILMVYSFVAVGGYQKLVEKYPYAVATKRNSSNSCADPPSDYMNLLRSPYPGASDLPWTGIVFGQTVKSIWYWCTDQVIVQRTLASKNLSHAKGGCIFASYLKLLPLWLLIFPGMAARVLYPERVACADPEECQKICGSPGGCSNIAYAELVIKLLPSGLSGLMLAVMMAALMSSLTSIFNSASTIFTIDVWRRFRNKASDIELVIVGRTFVVVLVIISVIWIPVIQSTGTSRLFDYIQSISSFLSPPICAIYLLAMFWHRTTEPGAFWGLVVGLIFGLLRFILEFIYTAPPCYSDEVDTRPWFIVVAVGKVHYLHYGFFLFVITGTVVVIVSLLTEPIPEQCILRLTFWTRKSVAKRRRILSPDDATDSQTEGSDQDNREEEPSKIVIIIYRICGGKKQSEKSTKKQETDENRETSANNAETSATWERKTEAETEIKKETSLCDAETSATGERKTEAEMELDILQEKPFWKRFANVNAILCIGISFFFWGFYA